MTQTAQFGQATDFDVIIVGAGAAGLAATKALVDAHRSVICLEAAGRIGGRAHTDTQMFGVPFDMGAHWLHTEQLNPFIQIGQSMGFDVYPVPDHYLTHRDEQDTLWDGVAAMDAQLTRSIDHGADVSMLEVFQRETPWSETAAMLHTLDMGRDMAEISMQEWSLDIKGRDWLCRQGFGALVAAYAGPLPVKLNTPVSTIARTAAGVRVDTPHGSMTAQAVIVTVSQGVLASEAIRFDPPLETPRLRAIEAITMGRYNHIALKFAPETLPVKPDTWVTYQIDPTDDGILRGGGFLCDATGTGLTCFEAAGSFARELEEAGQVAAIEFALSKLVEVFGADIRHGFEKGYATQWGNDPLTQGSYSGALPGGTALRQHLTDPHADAILFAGEATHLSQMATVAGAHKEGRRAAKDVLGRLGSP